MYWGRDYLSIAMMTRAVLEQIRVVVPGLNMMSTQAAVITVVGSTAAVSMMVGLSSIIGFPLPFAFDLGKPAWIAAVVVSFGFLFGRKLQHFAMSYKNIIAGNCPIILMFVYPVYLYGFGRVV